MKKEWEKPKLTVLDKGESEENVLCHCKTGAHYWDHGGPQNSGCVVTWLCGTYCNDPNSS